MLVDLQEWGPGILNGIFLKKIHIVNRIMAGIVVIMKQRCCFMHFNNVQF